MQENNYYEEFRQLKSILNATDASIIVIKNKDIISQKKGLGLRPFLELIKEKKEELDEAIIGDRILGKASALLCTYSKIKGVYSPQATQNAIKILEENKINYRVDEIVDYVKNKDQSGMCPFEKMLENINSADEAYFILNQKIME